MKTYYLTHTFKDFGKVITSILLIDIVDCVIQINTTREFYNGFDTDDILSIYSTLSSMINEHFKDRQYIFMFDVFETELEMLKEVCVKVGENKIITWSDSYNELKDISRKYDFFDFELKDDFDSISNMVNNGLTLYDPGYKSLIEYASEVFNIRLKRLDFFKSQGFNIKQFDVKSYGSINTDQTFIFLMCLFGAISAIELFRYNLAVS